MLDGQILSRRWAELCLAAFGGFTFALVLLLQPGWRVVVAPIYFAVSNSNSNSEPVSDKVQIVIWTPPHHPPSSGRLERLHSIETGMPVQPCFEGCRLKVSSEQWEVDRADGVVFFMFMGGFKREELPLRSRPDQIWVYNQHEPPPNFSPGPHLNSLFNWTMTYRLDSDVYQPYYRLLEGEGSTPINRTWLQAKTGVACAVVSNCKTSSKRELILKRLQASGLKVDIYGGCGALKGCGRYDKDCSSFWRGLANKYRYFLAFENSLCVDYITEKFWRPLELGMVPVVLGRGNYSSVAPPNSYVDLRDFKGPKELVEFLQRLAGDEEEYARYFEWRNKFRILGNTDDFCDLCRKLKEFKGLVKTSSSYRSQSNLRGWWGQQAGGGGPACLAPYKMGLGMFLQ